MGTYLVGGLVLAAALLAARSVYRNVKSGDCPGGCAGCSSSCHGCAQEHAKHN